MKTFISFLVGSTAIGWAFALNRHPEPERLLSPTARVSQWSDRTCGPAAVATLLNVYGKGWSPADLERECRTTREGTSFAALEETLERHGLQAEGFQSLSASGLVQAPRPYLAHLPDHFVVVERYRNGRLEVFDPTSGEVRPWSPETLFSQSRGWIMTVSVP